MVRLKGNGVTITGDGSKFQFQYGTIKRVYFVSLELTDYKFQFQYGTIKSVQVISFATSVYISIPVWYD